ncbi:MAG: LysE family transporter [Gammaproteobacteria bacterium]|nr:LysE family transporter [Gammaproteobacteria bacterium]
MGSPGPATISLAGIGTGFGFRKGVPYLLGIILGTVGVLILIATGVSALVLAIPAFITGLTVLATLYILYLAWKIATAPVLASNKATSTAPSLMSGFFLAIANPKAFAAIGAVYTSHTLINGDIFADSLIKILALAVVIVIVNSAWLLLGSSFSRVLSNEKQGRIANIVFGIMLLVSVALALVTL